MEYLEYDFSVLVRRVITIVFRNEQLVDVLTIKSCLPNIQVLEYILSPTKYMRDRIGELQLNNMLNNM